jgi:hypothetical protein
MKVLTLETYIHQELGRRFTQYWNDEKTPEWYAWHRFYQERDNKTSLYQSAIEAVLKQYPIITHVPQRINMGSIYSRWVDHCECLAMLHIEQYYIDQEEARGKQTEHKSDPLSEAWKRSLRFIKAHNVNHLDNYTMHIQRLRKICGESVHFTIDPSDVDMEDKTRRFVYVDKSGHVKPLVSGDIAEIIAEGFLIWPDMDHNQQQHKTADNENPYSSSSDNEKYKYCEEVMLWQIACLPVEEVEKKYDNVSSDRA